MSVSGNSPAPGDHGLLIFDGAFGTTVQSMDLPDSVWDGIEGCNEYLNLSAPAAVTELHRSFLEAGAQVIETNTFGATRIVLAEYGLADRVEEINSAAVANARAAICGMQGPRYIAGSVGPTTKLPSLGHISIAEMFDAVAEQMRVLLREGVDLIIVETCQDLLQLKTCLIAAHECFEQTSRSVPLMASVTMERSGTMLVGSDMAAVAVTLEPFDLFSLGLNCATGPGDMESHIRFLSQQWPGRISCMPNQGLPEMIGGQTVYPMTPDEFAAHMRLFVERYGVSVVGGCCGSSPDHIRALVREVRNLTPAARRVES